MSKHLYRNLLENQNETVMPNIIWVSDITEIEVNDKKVCVYICIDIHTNYILTYLVSLRTIKSSAIVRSLRSVLFNRFGDNPPKKPVILHSDRGTQFSSNVYAQFVEENALFITPSMSRANTPNDNSVMERYMRTFKNHKVSGLTIKEDLIQHLDEDKQFKSYRALVGKYCASLNNKPNKKTNKKSPISSDNERNIASMLMVDPKYRHSFSELYGFDPRRVYIDDFKNQNKDVVSILEEWSTVHAEVVKNTPFDDLETTTSIKQTDKYLNELLILIKSNPETTRAYVEKALEPVIFSMEELHNKIDRLLPKEKIKHNPLKLRDPLTNQMLPVFSLNAGSQAKYQRDLHHAQLVICYTILFHVGLRINELRVITLKDIQDAIKATQLSVIHYKTNQSYVHVLSKEAIFALNALDNELFIVFEKYKYNYLFGKTKPMHEKALIRFINNDLKATAELNNIPFNIKSHSFRINMVTSLLKITSVQNVASIVGHADIRTTMAYNRYALSKSEISSLLSEMANIDQEKD